MRYKLDKFLDSITMYRLMLYGLALLAVISTVLAFLGALPLQGQSLLISAVLLLVVGLVVNWIFATILHASKNTESSAITALILFFVMTPATGGMSYWTLIVAVVVAMASKYVFAIRGRHIFNPAATGAVVAGLAGLGGSSWWVSLPVMLPFVLMFGLLVVRKLRRFEMFFMFLGASLISIVVFNIVSLSSLQITGVPALLWQVITTWPLIFFGTIMFTEPLTTPPTRRHRLVYGIISGALFGLPLQIGGVYLTSELALMFANIYSFATSLKMRLVMVLKEKRKLAPQIFEYIFSPNRRFAYTPGQYLEWTLPHRHQDDRGVRRFFTIASSPTESDMSIAIKIAKKSSSFKKKLSALELGNTRGVVAGQLAGDFVLPKDASKSIVFMAGGIGVTPFRSMVKYMLDTGQKRDIVFFYACNSPEDFVYKNLFDQANRVGVKMVYVVTDESKVPTGWSGKTGYIDKDIVESLVSGYKKRIYYLSGPPGMVNAYYKLLKALKISSQHIKKDYFSGY